MVLTQQSSWEHSSWEETIMFLTVAKLGIKDPGGVWQPPCNSTLVQHKENVSHQSDGF